MRHKEGQRRQNFSNIDEIYKKYVDEYVDEVVCAGKRVESSTCKCNI